MELDRGLGIRSSFNFIPEGPYDVPEPLRRELSVNGFEIGVQDLHHDGRLYASRRSFAGNARRINEYLAAWGAVGFRSGFMFHNLEWLHELNVLYDSSTFDTDPFEPQPDGVGTIFPFWVPNCRREAGLDGKGYVELPYTLPQDSTLFLLMRERTTDIWLKKLDWVAEHGGMVLLNVHPDYLALEGSNASSDLYPVELYSNFLKTLTSKYRGAYWQATAAELARWYKQMLPDSQHARFIAGQTCSESQVAAN
jgi:hypothetical protein